MQVPTTRKNRENPQTFLQVSIAIDTEKQIALTSVVTQHPTHDATLAGNLLKPSAPNQKSHLLCHE